MGLDGPAGGRFTESQRYCWWPCPFGRYRRGPPQS